MKSIYVKEQGTDIESRARTPVRKTRTDDRPETLDDSSKANKIRPHSPRPTSCKHGRFADSAGPCIQVNEKKATACVHMSCLHA